MGIPLVIQGEDGKFGHGGDGYGYTVADHWGALDQKLRESGGPLIDDFVYLDPDSIEEIIEFSESMGDDTTQLQEELKAAREGPAWFSSDDGLKLVERLEQVVTKLELNSHELKEMQYDLQCYREILEGLLKKGQRFRLFSAD